MRMFRASARLMEAAAAFVPALFVVLMIIPPPRLPDAGNNVSGGCKIKVKIYLPTYVCTWVCRCMGM
jgi:hypothetical protein